MLLKSSATDCSLQQQKPAKRHQKASGQIGTVQWLEYYVQQAAPADASGRLFDAMPVSYVLIPF